MASNFTIQNLLSLHSQVHKFPQIPAFSMFNFIPPCSSILPQFRFSIRPSLSINKLQSLPLQSSPSSPVSDNYSIGHSFRVSYLVEKFGWTPESAISKAKYLKFKTPEQPEKVLAFLKNYGFTETQISIIVKRDPRFLVSDPDNTFLPKLAFLRSIGLSRTEVTSVVTEVPSVLKCSLENRIAPAFNVITKLVNSDGEAVKIVKQYPIILLHGLDVDSLQILLEAGVPKENILDSMIYARKWRSRTPHISRKMVEEVTKIGFDPRSKMFLLAIRTIKSMSICTWEDKVRIFKKYGFSDLEILLAYRNSPNLIMRSKDQIEGVMDFLVNIIGVEATSIANYSNIFSFSLKKRIVPRCLVYQTLLEKGLWKGRLSILSLCQYSENKFVSKVIKPYESEAPELWDLYKELLDLGNDL